MSCSDYRNLQKITEKVKKRGKEIGLNLKLFLSTLTKLSHL
jgi:hypothetical protein